MIYLPRRTLCVYLCCWDVFIHKVKQGITHTPIKKPPLLPKGVVFCVCWYWFAWGSAAQTPLPNLDYFIFCECVSF